MRQQFTPTANKCRRLQPAAAAASRGGSLQTPASGAGSASGTLSRAKYPSSVRYGAAPRRKARYKQPGPAQPFQHPFGKGDRGRSRAYKPASLHPGLLWCCIGSRCAKPCHATAPGAQGDTRRVCSQRVLPFGSELRTGRDDRQQRRSQLVSAQAQALQGTTSAVFLA